MTRSLDILGAGVIGLSIAWRAAQRGRSVRVWDRSVGAPSQPGASASWVAGGMLAPFSEAWPGHEPLLRLGADSLARWPAFAAELGANSPDGTVLAAQGTLVVGATAADLAALAPGLESARGAGLDSRRSARAELREIEPGLAADVRGGWILPQEPAADNRALLAALAAAARGAGVEFVAQSPAQLPDSGADDLVVAVGAAAPALLPGLPVRPVKGEILRLAASSRTAPPPKRTIRALVRGRHVYLVPRRDGVVVGATELEGDARAGVSAQAIVELLSDALAILPGLADYELVEACAGFRPVTPDRCPLLGWTSRPATGPRSAGRCLVATGHGRDGMLLAPLTADLAVALLDNEQVSEQDQEALRAMDPARFPYG
ncbi:glycine oxidase ThiO [Segniliparus rotundus DSM 44985]|uniref:glycine oxidase n=1 Tax=Segniliparus rotundus (strain ATCC BAA-972 / CDC 1076 / CIP 108378 / DSM 44985 / JCM 13578) TaxID=640132 RepID=D6ZFI1_SEGRD|nr:glycine oxidase ThiO [Segniliparus rotundus]ADG97705.1 glycine oxidase ThiO [Segniliparus rotundus DSM 44985]